MDERLLRLEQDRGISVKDLQSSDEFEIVLLHATQTALRNHQAEKRDALRSAVTNAALDTEPDIDQRADVHPVDR